MFCPACYQERQIDAGEAHREWTLYRCPNCSVEHFWPAKNPGADWYEANEMYEARDFAVVDWLAWYHRAGLALLSKRDGRLVDVGCGNGTFVAAARDRGFDAFGIDFSQKAIEAGKQRFSLEQLYTDSIEGLRKRFSDRYFDVVTAFEVLEHVDDVGEFLTALNSLLKLGGSLVISVPNRERSPRLLNEGDLPPHHFTRWNRQAMTQVLAMYGFDVESIVVCPASPTVKNWLLVKVHFNFVMRMLRRAQRPQPAASQDHLLWQARSLIVAKDRLAGWFGTVVGPAFAPFVRGPMMVTVARKTREVGPV